MSPALRSSVPFSRWLALTTAAIARRGGLGAATRGAIASLAVFVLVLGDFSSRFGYDGRVATLLAILITSIGWVLHAPGVLSSGRGREPWPRAAFWLIAASVVALALPIVILPVPMDTDAQGFGYLSLAIRQGGSLSNLSPWHPEIEYLYPPGALLVFASLSLWISNAPMSAIMMGATHAAGLLFILGAGLLGAEISQHITALQAERGTEVRADRCGRWASLAMLSAMLSGGFWTALLDSHYTAIFGLVFGIAFFHSTLRYLRLGSRLDAGMAALFFAASWITHIDTAIALTVGLFALLAVWPFARDRPPRSRWLVVAIAIPGMSILALAPWISALSPLVSTGIRSPFDADLSHWRQLVLYQGLLWPILALVGIWLSGRTRLWVLAMAGWLGVNSALAVWDVAGTLSATPFDRVLRYTYPFSLAWHGPIIPILALATGALAQLTLNIKSATLSKIGRVFGSVAMFLLGVVFFARRPILLWSKGIAHTYGSFSTSHDLQAMLWIRSHTPADSRILNYPGNYPRGRDWEAAWAPVISERDSVYFRWQPFFVADNSKQDDRGTVGHEQLELMKFWQDPLDPENTITLAASGIDYILVPEVIAEPYSWTETWRWRQPEVLPGTGVPARAAPHLELVYQAGGAQVLAFSP